MRILLVLYGALDSASGGFFYDRRLVEHLEAAGDTVALAELPAPDWPRGVADNLAVRRRLVDRVAEIRPDVVVEDELAHPSLVAANRHLARLGVPTVAVVHLLTATARAGTPEEAAARRLEGAYLSALAGAVAVNQPIAGRIPELAGRPVPTVVAPPAADHLPAATDEEVVRRATAPGPLRALFLGSLTRAKGFPPVVDALMRLGSRARSDGGVVLRAVGDPTLEPDTVAAARRQLDEAGLADRVEWHGAVPLDEVPTHLSASHVLAMPSWPESASIAYLEAHRRGLPVVACREADAAALVADGTTGFLVPRDDPAAVASALLRLADDRSLLAERGRAALVADRTRPGWSESMERVRRFLGTVRAGADRPRPTTSA